MVATVVPDPDALPHVLPTERLAADGRPRPPLRDELRRISSWRNLLTVAGAWAQVVLVVGAAVAVDHPLAYAAAFLLQGRAFALLLILAHEAAHRLLVRDRRVNDTLGRWLLAYPGFTPFDAYRRAHMAHHRDALGANEPDLGLYAGYPVSRASLRRKLVRDAVGISGWKNLAPLLRALGRPSARGVALRILAVQAVLWTLSWLLSGRWWVYPLLWFAPWMTVWRVINRLRAIAEHGGMRASDDQRLTTHHVRQHWAARFWMVPYHTGWHLAHHVDPGVTWRNLPRLQRELDAAGWTTQAITHRSYLRLWRALASG